MSTAHAQSVDILWQGETYTPPFYEGKRLWSKQSMITLLAIPQGVNNPGGLIYKWTQNGTVLGVVSGPGRNTLRFEDSIFSKPQLIKVEILTSNNLLIAESQTTIIPITAEPLIFEKNPLLGYLFHKEVGEIYRFRDSEATFTAFPLFSTPAEREDSGLIYTWRTGNDASVSQNSITYRAPEGSGGSARVRMTLSNPGKILENINRDFLVQFGDENE